LLSRTRAILRSAELGFLGVIVLTWVQTPRLNGEPLPRVSFPLSELLGEAQRRRFGLLDHRLARLAY